LARATLAVFAFALLTAWPLLADRHLGDREQAQVARLAEQGSSSIHEDPSCQT
jgi:hypothetical protein